MVIEKSILGTILVWSTLLCTCLGQSIDGQTSDFISSSPNSNELFRIEGKVYTHEAFPLSSQFLVGTKIIVNYGQYYGFLRY